MKDLVGHWVPTPLTVVEGVFTNPRTHKRIKTLSIQTDNSQIVLTFKEARRMIEVLGDFLDVKEGGESA